jgi:Ni,Fe-hydrogenase III large subunit
MSRSTRGRRAFLESSNGHPERLAAVPLLEMTEFRRAVVDSVAEGASLSVLFALPLADNRHRLVAVLADPATGILRFTAAGTGGSFPSLTPDCPAAHLFERAMFEDSGIVPEGHPWLKPVRRTGDETMYRVEGDEVHEVAVGPVHAGVIEPGHFRFQCHGEQVMHLEISLGYQHRGAERLLSRGPDARTLHVVETIAGDTTVGHALAHCEALEGLGGCSVPARSLAIRAVALELERIANHVGDLGALAGDVAFLPAASFCGRIRGDVLNLTAAICGSRFGRGLVVPGGTRFDVDDHLAGALRERLGTIARDAHGAIELMWKTQSVTSRFEGTGVLTAETAGRIGLVGPAARASGIGRDVRHDFPSGWYRFAHVPVSTTTTGDVSARAWVRWLEVQRSIAFVDDQLRGLPAGPVRAEVLPDALARRSIIATMVEAWRGESCHVVVTGPTGRFTRCAVVDPSFHNWLGLALAMRGGQISDFPLCNKSFNLSYCGHDL